MQREREREGDRSQKQARAFSRVAYVSPCIHSYWKSFMNPTYILKYIHLDNQGVTKFHHAISPHCLGLFY
jgi:hypothetical protein